MVGFLSWLKFLRNINVKKQLNFLYITSLLIPLFMIGTILIFNAKKLLLDHYTNMIEKDNTRVKSIMFDVTTTVYNISDEIFMDKNLQTLLSTRYTTEQEASNNCRVYYNKINDYLTRNTCISSIELYTNNPTISRYATIIPVTLDVMKSDWYTMTSNRADVMWKSLESIDYWKHTSWELCLLRRIPVISTGEYTVLVIRISNNYLNNRIQNDSLLFTLSTNEDPIFFSTNRNLIGEYPNLSIDYNKQLYQYSGRLDYEGHDTIAHISTLIPYNSKSKVYVSTVDYEALPETTNIILLITVIFFLGSILPFTIFKLFTHWFNSRIITLRREMHKASNGDYNIIDSFEGNDELTQVFSDLKLMIHSIKEMDSMMYESKIQEEILKNQQQKMEYKLLASQINPHFLYNTLETLRMKALMEGNLSIANGVKLLGKSMHYVLENNGTSSTSLKKELDYIVTYLTIQKLRFGDRVNYTLRTPADLDLEECQILPLLLQPIVENSILHGLERAKYIGQITIEVKPSNDNNLIINILDNGLGIPEEELFLLRADLANPKKQLTMNIGLHNINQRIKLFYGELYGLTIKSRPKEGTLVTVTIPLHIKLEE